MCTRANPDRIPEVRARLSHTVQSLESSMASEEHSELVVMEMPSHGDIYK